MVYLESKSYDPYYNLALEQCVFDELPRDESYFMLWQNSNAVIIGRYQNTVAEINAGFIAEHDIRVARRLSGGGAVYHDLGNVNYTFITDAGRLDTLDLHMFCMPLVDALKKLGVNAEVSGRNDVTIDGQKCSGNSQYLKDGRVMHHGTILFDSDLSMISGALNVLPDKIASKGVKSVRSRVTNIRPKLAQDVSVSEFIALLKTHMVSDADMKTLELGERELGIVARLRQERYSTWDWNYGASPQYSIHKARRVENCGRIELLYEAEKGVITAFCYQGDFFGSGDSKELIARLLGCRLEEASLMQRLEGFPLDHYIKGLTAEQLVSVILQ